MYSVSEAYIEQMMKRGTRRRLTGTIGSVAFTGADVVSGSFSISARATEESNTKIGGVYLGEIEMTFVPSFLNKVARTAYKDSVVSVYIGLYVEEEGEESIWVDVPIGVYTLDAPKISKQGISVTGYDNMKKLDKSFRIDQSDGTIYSFLTYISTRCGITLGQTQEEIEALPNGTEYLGLHTGNDIETCRDFLYWIAQTCGCFACADREGNIVLRKMGIPNDVEVDEEHRDADVVFSGYTTKWTGVSFVDIDTQMTRYYGLEVDDGLTMNMGANPLLQTGSTSAIERRRRAVLDAVAQIQYTPFYMNSARDPIFDLGDEIEFTGGISGNATGCVMALSFSLNNYNFEGYGDDPDLANARSKTDKDISGLMQNTIENEITYYNFTNLEEITFGSEQETSIAKLRFTAAQKTTIKILHEFLFDMLADLAVGGSYEVLYYLDNELVSYHPYEQLGAIQSLTAGDDTSISICRDFFYIISDVEPNLSHTWEVKIITHDIESTTIGIDHAHITIEGQRLYGEEYWGGFIEASDILSIIPLDYLTLVSITDSASLSLPVPVSASASDNIVKYSIDDIGIAGIVDDLTVYMESAKLDRITEEGYGRITEDGYGRVSE